MTTKPDQEMCLRSIALIDLTTLAHDDTPERIKNLCQRAIRPAEHEDLPSCAAVCVWPNFVPVAKKCLASSHVKLACVAAAFPYSQAPLQAKLAEVSYAAEQGADEVDIVINRGDFLSGETEKVHDEIAAIKQACGKAHLKVILEVCDLPSLDSVSQASHLAIQAGADFIKTSTGKGKSGATLESVEVMLQIAKAHREKTGQLIGVKAAGGIRTSNEALAYLKLADRYFDPALPENFRFGASSLLDQLLKNLHENTPTESPID